MGNLYNYFPPHCSEVSYWTNFVETNLKLMEGNVLFNRVNILQYFNLYKIIVSNNSMNIPVMTSWNTTFYLGPVPNTFKAFIICLTLYTHIFIYINNIYSILFINGKSNFSKLKIINNWLKYMLHKRE